MIDKDPSEATWAADFAWNIAKDQENQELRAERDKALEALNAALNERDTLAARLDALGELP